MTELRPVPAVPPGTESAAASASSSALGPARPAATDAGAAALAHGVIGYGFFALGETPHRALAALGARFSLLRFALVPRPTD